jgi:hypothetical protein
MTNISIRWPALCAGILATTGALIILLQDVLRSGHWQIEHMLIPLLLAVQILTAHNIWPAAKARRLDSFLGFLALAVMCTYGLLFMSITKQSSVAATAKAHHDHVVAERAKLEPKLALNQAMLEREQAELAKEARSACKDKCEGKKVSVQVYKDAVKGVEAELAALGPVIVQNPGATAMAEIIAATAGGNQARIEHLIVITWPFVLASIFEGVALVSFGFAIAHSRKPLPAANDTGLEKVAAPEFPPPGNGGRKLLPASRTAANVVSFSKHPVVAALEKVAGPVSNGQLARLMGVSDGEASKRWQEIARDLSVSREGRELRIALKKIA